MMEAADNRQQTNPSPDGQRRFGLLLAEVALCPGYLARTACPANIWLLSRTTVETKPTTWYAVIEHFVFLQNKCTTQIQFGDSATRARKIKSEEALQDRLRNKRYHKK